MSWPNGCRFILFGLVGVLSVQLAGASPAQPQSLPQALPQTLHDCFEAALQQSEVIAQHRELITQAEERYNQAKAGLFPVVSGVASYLVQQAPNGGSASSIAPAEQTTARLTAAQPLFHGMREYAALLQQNLQVTAEISARRAAAAALYNDVASNFYTILALERTLQNYKNELSVYESRIIELNQRLTIGRAKSSEVLTVRSTLDALAAQAESVSGQLETTREAFAFLTGLAQNTPLRDADAVNPAVKDLESYLRRIEERPDVKAASDALEAVDKGVTIARAGHFPNIDLLGDYYFKRPGVAQNQHWAVQLQATVPIFAGGFVNAQIREASSKSRYAELALSQARRRADEEVRSSYKRVRSDLAQANKLQRAAESAEATNKAQTRDYKLGLVTNIDVLQSITAAQQATRALDTVRYQLKLDFIKLETAAALRPSPKGELKDE